MVVAVCALTACESDDKPEPIAQECYEVKVVVHIPDGTMPTYTTRTADSKYALRGVAEVYAKDCDRLLRHQAVMLTPTAQTNVFYMMLDSLPQNDLDVYVWTDYSADISDLYYNTKSLRGIRFNDVGKKAGDSNLRRAYFGKTTIGVKERAVAQPIKAKTPFAHYRIEALDIADYERMQHVNGWPDLEDVQIRITYKSYVPTSFNIMTGQPNDAEVGKSFTCSTLQQENGKVIVADDYVFVTGTESSVIINIEVINPATEEVIASAENVEIYYRQGYVTTVSGDFLTADSSLDGNIGITTRWDGEYNVEF